MPWAVVSSISWDARTHSNASTHDQTTSKTKVHDQDEDDTRDDDEPDDDDTLLILPQLFDS